MQIKKIGVIGAGQMGNGIAHVLSLGGYNVLLNDINKDILNKASLNIESNLERQVNSKKISSEESLEALKLISYTVSLKDFNDCLLYTSPSPRDQRGSRMPSSA